MEEEESTALELIDFGFSDRELTKTADEQLKAFYHYYNMGQSRKMSDLSSVMGLSENKLKGWRRRFNWDRRIKALDSKVVGYIDEKFGDLYSEVKGICQQVIFDLMQTAKDDIESGELKIESVKDLETVMKMDLLLRGDATERVESKSMVLSLKQDMANMSVKQLEEILDNDGK